MVNFAWKSGGPLLSIGTVCRELYKKMAEPIKILFGMKAWVGPSNHILDVKIILCGIVRQWSCLPSDADKSARVYDRSASVAGE